MQQRPAAAHRPPLHPLSPPSRAAPPPLRAAAPHPRYRRLPSPPTGLSADPADPSLVAPAPCTLLPPAAAPARVMRRRWAGGGKPGGRRHGGSTCPPPPPPSTAFDRQIPLPLPHRSVSYWPASWPAGLAAVASNRRAALIPLPLLPRRRSSPPRGAMLRHPRRSCRGRFAQDPGVQHLESWEVVGSQEGGATAFLPVTGLPAGFALDGAGVTATAAGRRRRRASAGVPRRAGGRRGGTHKGTCAKR